MKAGDLEILTRKPPSQTGMTTPLRMTKVLKLSQGLTGAKLFRWLLSQRASFLPYHTVYLVADNRDLQADEVQTTPGLAHWPKVAAWWQERIRYVGPYGELTTVVLYTYLETQD